jgi:hypothetical protein
MVRRDRKKAKNDAKPEGKTCAECGVGIDSGTYCGRCVKSRRLRTSLTQWQTILALVSGLAAVIATGLIPAVRYIADRNSSTSFLVTGADAVYIHVWLANTGRQPSILRGYRLVFDGGLPIENQQMQLGHDDEQAGKNVIPPGQTVQIALVVKGLRPKTTQRAVIEKLIASAEVKLEIEVKESDDPQTGLSWFISNRRFHVRTDTFPADRIREFIMRNVPSKA